MSTVSFDFDGVLSQLAWQMIAVSYQESGDDVYILTARCEAQGDRVKTVADKLDIPRANVIFTCNRDKWEAMDQYEIDLHFDNNQEQVDKINELSNGQAINIDKIEPVDVMREHHTE